MVKKRSRAKNAPKRKIRIGVVTSRFNSVITEKLEEGALKELARLGLGKDQIQRVSVPGAMEIPLLVKSLFASGCDGVVALGCVIRGETSHFDYVCNAVERGCSQVSLEVGRPVGFGVLTTENEDQAWDRAGGSMGNKGQEAAQVTVELVGLLEQLND